MAEKKEKPLTREDVLKKIEEHGCTADGLDLSGKVFEEGIDLSGLDLSGIILTKADLRGAHLEGADLGEAYLEGAHLGEAHLEEAHLGEAHLEEADLFLAHLEGAYLGGAYLEKAVLWGAKFSAETRLETAEWGNFILGDEKPDSFHMAADTYRRLKQWYTNAGIADTAAKFYYREKEANRKALKLFSRSTWNHRLALEFLRLLFGYGESWRRVLASIAVLIVLFAIIYYAIIPAWKFGDFLWSLYFSAVSFTALGYGSWVKLGNDLTSDFIRGVGAFESLIGVSMLALLLVTFFRKWTR